MKLLTIITTTYNRAYCLHQVYEALCRQTCDNFLWLIVDDGSTDDTASIVSSWKETGKIEIQYFFKPNGGMHTARNFAYEKTTTEINMIVDSDDWLTDDAVEKITMFWGRNKSDQYYGIVANNINPKGELIGSSLPGKVKSCTLTDLFGKYHVKGDKKLILRSDLSRLHPFPEFPGEKFYPASYKYRLLDLAYELLIFDTPIGIVDYTDNSMTFNKFAQYKSCCHGFAHYRNEMIRISSSFRHNLREAIHYIAEAKMAGEKHYIRNSSKPLFAFLAWGPGLAYYWFLQHTSRKY